MSDFLIQCPSACKSVSQSVREMVLARIPDSEQHFFSWNMLVYFEWLTHTALFENVTRADGNPFNGESYVRGLKFYSAMGEDVHESLIVCLEEHYTLFPPNGSRSRRAKLAQSLIVQDDDIQDSDDALMLMARDQRRKQLDSAGQVGY